MPAMVLPYAVETIAGEIVGAALAANERLVYPSRLKPPPHFFAGIPAEQSSHRGHGPLLQKYPWVSLARRHGA